MKPHVYIKYLMFKGYGKGWTLLFHAIKWFKFNLKHYQFRNCRNERSVPRKTLNICHQRTVPKPRLPRAIVNKHTGKQTVRRLSLSLPFYLFQEMLVRSILTENKQSRGLCYSHHALLKQWATIWRGFVEWQQGFRHLKNSFGFKLLAAVSLQLDLQIQLFFIPGLEWINSWI